MEFRGGDEGIYRDDNPGGVRIAGCALALVIIVLIAAPFVVRAVMS